MNYLGYTEVVSDSVYVDMFGHLDMAGGLNSLAAPVRFICLMCAGPLGGMHSETGPPKTKKTHRNMLGMRWGMRRETVSRNTAYFLKNVRGGVCAASASQCFLKGV